MRSAAAWLEARGKGAPPQLAERARFYLAMVEATPDRADHLARAALAALRATVHSCGDRSTALDLLAADALVTLALLARAETNPAHLAALAVEIRSSGTSFS